MLRPGMSRREILHEVVRAESGVHELLAEAARLTPDPEERRLFTHLAGLEEDALRALAREEDLLEAEEFVQQAVEV
jgi:hypothetical protein